MIYGVSSDGDKFKGLAMKCEMEHRRRASEVERDAWHYHATMAELDVVEYQKAYTQLAAHQQGIGACAPERCSVLAGEVREGVGTARLPSWEPPALADGVLFDIRRSSPGTAVHSTTGRSVESIHLDSGYHVCVPRNTQFEADPVSDGEVEEAQSEADPVSVPSGYRVGGWSRASTYPRK